MRSRVTYNRPTSGDYCQWSARDITSIAEHTLRDSCRVQPPRRLARHARGTCRPTSGAYVPFTSHARPETSLFSNRKCVIMVIKYVPRKIKRYRTQCRLKERIAPFRQRRWFSRLIVPRSSGHSRGITRRLVSCTVVVSLPPRPSPSFRAVQPPWSWLRQPTNPDGGGQRNIRRTHVRQCFGFSWFSSVRGARWAWAFARGLIDPLRCDAIRDNLLRSRGIAGNIYIHTYTYIRAVGIRRR